MKAISSAVVHIMGSSDCYAPSGVSHAAESADPNENFQRMGLATLCANTPATLPHFSWLNGHEASHHMPLRD